MKTVTVNKWLFRGVHGQFPIFEDKGALELARRLGGDIVKAAKGK